MGAVNIIIGVLVLIVSLVIIAFVLGQEGRRSGISGTISGAADTFLSKKGARDFDAKAKRITQISVIIFFVLVIFANIWALDVFGWKTSLSGGSEAPSTSTSTDDVQ